MAGDRHHLIVGRSSHTAERHVRSQMYFCDGTDIGPRHPEWHVRSRVLFLGCGARSTDGTDSGPRGCIVSTTGQRRLNLTEKVRQDSEPRSAWSVGRATGEPT